MIIFAQVVGKKHLPPKAFQFQIQEKFPFAFVLIVQIFFLNLRAL